MKNSNKTISILAIVLMATAFISSCKKEEKDTEKPTLTIFEPTANDTVSGEVHVELTASDNKELKEISFRITNTLGEEVYNKAQPIPGLSSFNFHEHYDVAGIPVITNLNVVVQVKDKSDNTETVTIPIVVKP